MPTRGRQMSIRIGKITGTCYSSLSDREVSTKKPTSSWRRAGAHKIEHLFRAGLFTEVIKINPLNHPVREILLFHFRGEEVEVQVSEVTSGLSHTASKRQGQDLTPALTL